MNFTELAEYRRLSGLPSDLDLWLKAAVDNERQHPAGTVALATPPASPQVRDYAECTLFVKKQWVCIFYIFDSSKTNLWNLSQGKIDGPFQDPHIYSLHLRLSLPESSGLLVYYRQSPCVCLATFEGIVTDPDVPDWIEVVGAHMSFQHPCLRALEVFRRYEMESTNEEVAGMVDDWCEVCQFVSMISKRELTELALFQRVTTDPRKRRPAFHQRSSTALVPTNARSHKPRASDFTVEESISYRLKSTQDGSPVYRRRF